MTFHASSRLSAIFLWLAGCCCVASAQEPGVTGDKVLIGRVTPRSSAVFGGIARLRASSADAYFAAVNASGGVHGRKIVVVDRDDGYTPAQAGTELRKLAQQERIFALLGAWGSPTLPVAVQQAEALRIPLVGAMSLGDDGRNGFKRYVFPVRTSPSNEAHASVQHQVTLGLQRLAVLHSTEAFGPDGGKAYVEALRRSGIQPIAVVSYSMKDDPAQVAQRLHAAQPQVVFISTLPTPFSQVLKAYRQMQGTAKIVGFSVLSVDQFRAELGELASGMVMTQVTPPNNKTIIPLVAEFRDALAEYAPAGTAVTEHGLDAFLEAKVLVEGLKRAGRELSREKLVKALESLNNADFGGVNVRYSGNDRTGSTYVNLLLIGSGGRLVH